MIYDTITAIATPPGKAALGIIRISGSLTFRIVQSITKKEISKYRFRRLSKATFYSEDKVLDYGMLCLFSAPHSYTGEDMAELYCHGNDYILSAVLQTVLKTARLATKGEFTLRAFLNQKIDLTQAEAIGHVLSVNTQKTHESAVSALQGNLHHHIKQILDRFTKLRALFELAIDFVEDEVPDFDQQSILTEIDELLLSLQHLIDNAPNGIIIAGGLNVCLAGPPNVGKSSIFNALLQTERAIITEIPGTTRDFLAEQLSLEGYLIKVYDTAGLRDTADPIEKIGIEKTRKLINSADLMIYIIDASVPPDDIPENAINMIKVINKIDLLTETEIITWEEKDFIPCTTVLNNGLEPLKEAILTHLKTIDSENENLLTNSRQLACVKNAYSSLCKARKALLADAGYDFISFDIISASACLEEIIGKVSSDDVLDQIFADFCIGK